MNNTLTTEDFKGFMDAFGSAISNEHKELFQRVIDSSNIPGFSNPEEFFFSVLYPFDNFVDGFIRSKVSNNEDVVFIYKNNQFIERHFESVIKINEGWPCCADKSRTIMRGLVEFYSSGKEIQFNYDAEYTYHLPKKVFTSHAEIIGFYQGAKSLYYGNSDKFLKAMLKIIGGGSDDKNS